MQIKSRLTLHYILLFALILGFALAFFYSKYKEILVQEAFLTIKSQSSGLLDKLQLQEKFSPNTNDSTLMPSSFSLEVYNGQFQKLYSLSSVPIKIKYQDFLEILDHNEICRLAGDDELTVGFTRNQGRSEKLIIFAQKKIGSREISDIRQLLFLTFFISIGVAAIGGFWYTSHSLRPFKILNEQVDQILPSSLEVRLEENKNGDEISHLISTFNKMLDRIQEAFAYQRNFISNVAHELKNPISVMTSQLDILLQNKSRPEEEYREVAKSVLQDCFRLSDITDNLLQLARIHTNNGILTTESCRIEELLMDSRSQILRSRPECKIYLNYSVIPSNEELLYIVGNRSLLCSAFMNIMDNCCKFSSDQSAFVEMIIPESGPRKIVIKDNGPGIEESELSQIFKPFYRDVRTRNKQGTGIGLAVVDSVIKLHHIKLEIQSKIGIGTEFHLYLPDIV
ncbi:MAG: HAMP domain-containing histidine kinase [Saprospiraceae bacterium]|nr:HAMP domain-containing histidine kinase [Saprospiraceae bacterium]MBK9631479.1 HAMP domain-containing histidine kinase [Saprospiraceae bacterium]